MTFLSDGTPRLCSSRPETMQHTRRSSYGPRSPIVGDRGARTRQQILDAALASFSEFGFHGASVEEIAGRADTSRATLYQYFASKDEIFIELMTISGSALVRLVRRLGPLGPTSTGYDNLHWWLGEWSWVFERYAPMFIEWTNVNAPGAELRPRLAEFVDLHAEHFAQAMHTNGPYRHGDATTLATLVMALVSRTHYTEHLYETGLSHRELIDSLTIAIQLLLFPDTPHEVLVAGPSSAEPQATPPGDRRTLQPQSRVPAAATRSPPSPFAGLSKQAAGTVRRLLDAAGRVFAEIGFGAANVDSIVSEAGVARGTFYRYFSDKGELLVALAQECADAIVPPFEQLADPLVHADPIRLRACLSDLHVLCRHYGGVLKAWAESTSMPAEVMAPCGRVIDAIGAALRAMFGPRRAYPLDRRAGGVLLSAAIEFFPNEVRGTRHEPPAAEIVEAQAVLVERVLLAN